MKIATHGEPFALSNGDVFCNYPGHEWRPTLPLSVGAFRCEECGLKIESVKDIEKNMGGCRARYAPISWQPLAIQKEIERTLKQSK